VNRVIAYTLLCGYKPFRAEDRAGLVRETTRGRVQFHERFWRKVSETGESESRLKRATGADASGKDFIKGLLVVDPKKRMSAEEALKHPVSSHHLVTLSVAVADLTVDAQRGRARA
jgi:calcium/calmodulin-dependent protein kinase I